MRGRRMRAHPLNVQGDEKVLNLLKENPESFNKFVVDRNNDGDIERLRPIAYLGYSKNPNITKDVVAILKDVFRGTMPKGYKHVRESIYVAKEFGKLVPETSPFATIWKDINNICIRNQYVFAGYESRVDFNKVKSDFRKKVMALDYTKEDVAIRSKAKSIQEYLVYDILQHVKRM